MGHVTGNCPAFCEITESRGYWVEKSGKYIRVPGRRGTENIFQGQEEGRARNMFTLLPEVLRSAGSLRLLQMNVVLRCMTRVLLRSLALATKVANAMKL